MVRTAPPQKQGGQTTLDIGNHPSQAGDISAAPEWALVHPPNLYSSAGAACSGRGGRGNTAPQVGPSCVPLGVQGTDQVASSEASASIRSSASRDTTSSEASSTGGTRSREVLHAPESGLYYAIPGGSQLSLPGEAMPPPSHSEAIAVSASSSPQAESRRKLSFSWLHPPRDEPRSTPELPDMKPPARSTIQRI